MSRFRLSSPRSVAAFSLVEVAIALGVVSFCLVSLMALLLIGISSDNDTKELTDASSLAAEVAADLRATPTVSEAQAQGENPASIASPVFGFAIPGPGAPADATPQTLFFGADGTFSPTAGAASRARVSLACVPPSAGERGVTSVRILVTWPALADTTPSKWPAHAIGSFETMIALNRN